MCQPKPNFKFSWCIWRAPYICEYCSLERGTRTTTCSKFDSFQPLSIKVLGPSFLFSLKKNVLKINLLTHTSKPIPNPKWHLIRPILKQYGPWVFWIVTQLGPKVLTNNPNKLKFFRGYQGPWLEAVVKPTWTKLRESTIYIYIYRYETSKTPSNSPFQRYPHR